MWLCCRGRLAHEAEGGGPRTADWEPRYKNRYNIQ
jgi:hypothetical protein